MNLTVYRLYNTVEELPTVNSVIEDRLLFNFFDFRSSLVFEILLNKCPHFHDFYSRLLFETVFYSKQSSITEFTVYLCTIRSVWSKTTLISGGVGGEGDNPTTCDMGEIILMPLVLSMPLSTLVAEVAPIFSNFFQIFIK